MYVCAVSTALAKATDNTAAVAVMRSHPGGRGRDRMLRQQAGPRRARRGEDTSKKNIRYRQIMRVVRVRIFRYRFSVKTYVSCDRRDLQSLRYMLS